MKFKLIKLGNRVVYKTLHGVLLLNPSSQYKIVLSQTQKEQTLNCFKA